jgi:hypothetical protein
MLQTLFCLNLAINLKNKNMKNIIIILIVAFSIQCNAQSPIIDLDDRDGTRINGAYYKDVYNKLNPFEGTWLYTNGTTSLKIVLVKKEMKRLATYYEDIIIGEYQYVENGVEKFNSLSELNTIYPNEYYHKIKGNFIPYGLSPFPQVVAGEVRLELSFTDNMGGEIHVRKTMVGNQQAIQIMRRAREYHKVVGDPIVYPILPPEVIYTLIKQP